MPNITSLLKYSLKTNIVKSILFEIVSNTSRYFYTFGQCLSWPTVVDSRNANIFTIERTNNIVRITTKTPHGLNKNDKIIVSANETTTINNPVSTNAKTIASVERASDIVTIVTVTQHGYVIGDTVEIETDLQSINGIYTVTSATDGYTFTYVSRGTNISVTTEIDGTSSLYTSYMVLDVINETTFTYAKNGPNISTIQDTGKIYSVEKDIISSEDDPPSVSDSYPYELETRNNMLFMKLIDANDVSIVVPRINWQPGIVYDMYDEYSGDNLAYSGAASLSQASFYVLTDEFNVYKCIFNNNDQPSSIKPTSTSPTSEELTLSDGYIWKFLYTIPIALRNKFLTYDYMPVLSALTNQFYSNGSITNYTIVSSGNGYIKNTYSVKTVEIVSNGSGYTELSGQAGNIFNISSIERTSNKLKITLAETHNITPRGFADDPRFGGAVSVSSTTPTVVIGGNTVPTNMNGLHIITDVDSTTTITIDSVGQDIPLTTSGGTLELTGAVVEFPLPANVGGVQAKAYVSSYGEGGTIDKITVVEMGSGYLTPPLAQIEMLNGMTPLTEVDYDIVYDFIDQNNGYTEVVVEGDGYNVNNPYTIKQVVINDSERGVFSAPLTGEIFTFPVPDLDEGRKPVVDVVFAPIIKQYEVTNSGCPDGEGVVLIVNIPLVNEGPWQTLTTYQVGDIVKGSNNLWYKCKAVHVSDGSTTPITGTSYANVWDLYTVSTGYSVGDQITVNLTVNTQYNGTYPLDFVSVNQSSLTATLRYLKTGAIEVGEADSGTVQNVSGEIGYEVERVDIIDNGYGYSKPLIFGDDASGNFFPVFANNLTQYGFNCSLDENNQKNAAVLLPLINSNGQIESLSIVETGIGYTYANVTVKGYAKINGQLTRMTPQNTAGFVEANVQLRFSVGDIDSKQSTVELFAKEGSISAIKVENGGQNYSSGTRIVVIGDGTGCVAIPEIVNGKIQKVTLSNPGIGYTEATAYLSGPQVGNDPFVITPLNSGTGASVRVILSPKGGHGRDAISELYGKTLYFTSRLSTEKNKGIVTRELSNNSATPNDYRQLTILKNPLAYGQNEFYKKSLGSSCFLAGCTIDANNTTAYNQISQDDILEYDTGIGSVNKTFAVVEKEEIGDKYYLVLQPLDNFIPEVNSLIRKVTTTNTYSIAISSLELPDFNKFSGEMLYTNNRTNFTPSEEQSVVISTLINF